MIIGKGTKIGLDGTTCRIRGGGYGSHAWVAKITLNPEAVEDAKAQRKLPPIARRRTRKGPERLAREFCEKDMSGVSSSGKSGTISFDVSSPGVYQYKNFTSTSKTTVDGYVLIDEEGGVTEMTHMDALTRVQYLSDPGVMAPGVLLSDQPYIRLGLTKPEFEAVCSAMSCAIEAGDEAGPRWRATQRAMAKLDKLWVPKDLGGE